MNKRGKSAIKIMGCIALGLALVVGGAATHVYIRESGAERPADSLQPSVDRIHFLNTGQTDCFLIESNGKFALVDSGEDTENPRNFTELELEGYEEKVIAYLKAVAGDANGNVTLEWVLGTHAHSDHIGGFDSIILDPQITIKTAYLKPYDANLIKTQEIEEWDNQEVYQQMIAACTTRNVAIVQDLPQDAWLFENFTVQFFNTEMNKELVTGENENAVGTKLTIHGTTVFLAADINYLKPNTEKRIADQVGKVDLLKLGHHGYELSSSVRFLRKLNPDIVVVPTVERSHMTPTVRWKLAAVTKTSMLVTGEEDGIIADFTADGISMQYGIHQ